MSDTTFEEKIVSKLKEKFDGLEGKCSIQRARRITVDATGPDFMNIIEYISDTEGFTMLNTITGLDLGTEFQAIYHIANPNGTVINFKLNIPKDNPEIDTVTGIYQGGVLYERELKDMLGIIVKGLPPGHRYPLPETWPEGEYPLRKDWKQVGEFHEEGGTDNG